MNESLAYKLTPAGHEEQQPKRKYPEPDRHLENALKEWSRHSSIWGVQNLERAAFQSKYEKAEELVKPLDISIDQAYGLILNYQDSANPDITDAGIFLTALYNNSPERIFTFDLEIEKLDHLGFMLAAGKTLILNCKKTNAIGRYSAGNIVNFASATTLAQASSGLAINYGNVGDQWFAYENRGTAINYGTVKGEFGAESKGCVIDFGKCKEMGSFATGHVIGNSKTKFVDVKSAKVVRLNPSVKTEFNLYILDLKKRFSYHGNIQKIIEEIRKLGPMPAQKIPDDLDAILRRSKNA